MEIKFNTFETIADTLDSDSKKTELTNILNYISENAVQYDLDPNDIPQFIVPQFCKILDYYAIMSATCNTLSPEQEQFQQNQIEIPNIVEDD
ncbi:hypothetical protein IJM86_02775 [bacterium]|nr:hypothetical protein [bacterium]